MQEELIRPSQLRETIKKLHKEDVNDILKKKDEFIKIKCPTCMSENERKVFIKNGFNFVSCNNCSTIYINPRPSVEMLDDFYTNSRNMNFWNEHVFPSTENNRRSLIFEKRVKSVIDICKKYGNDFGRIIDVGAGFGTFCDVMNEKKAFKEVIAVEPSEPLANACKDKGICVINSPIENVDISDASVITSFEVIEHLFRPGDFIRKCYNVLGDNGLLFITTPNIEGFEMSMLMTLGPDKHTPNIGGPDHLNYFSPETFKQLLFNNGFETLEILTPGELDVDLVKQKLEKGEYDFSNIPIMKKIILDEFDTLGIKFQRFLSENKLSSHMWAVARKIKR